MRTRIAIVMLLMSAPAAAEYMDVLQVKLKADCTLQTYLAIAKDFNEQWAPGKGYAARVAVPIQSMDLLHVYWVGTASNAQAFGKAWDTWRDELQNENSVAAKLWARFQACSDNVARWGYDVY